MELREARKQIEKYDNDIERLLNDKEVLFNKTQPIAIASDNVNVKGGKRANKFLNYVILDEEKEIDKELDKTYNLKNNLEKWVDKELKILDKYNDLEAIIIYYKEDYVPKDNRPVTWKEIANKVHYSETQCRRIYRQYKFMRNI